MADEDSADQNATDQNATAQNATGLNATGENGRDSGGVHPHPAYEDYEAPDNNTVPIVIAAILGGVVVSWLILRRRGRD